MHGNRNVNMDVADIHIHIEDGDVPTTLHNKNSNEKIDFCKISMRKYVFLISSFGVCKFIKEKTIVWL